VRQNPAEEFAKSTRGFHQIHTRILINPHEDFTNFTRVVLQLPAPFFADSFFCCNFAAELKGACFMALILNLEFI